MSENPVRTDVLITVMTYPHPSRGHQELVCTAGITRSGEWVRLYPIDYRYRPRDQQFHKYQWISVNLHSHGAGNDRRKESRKPELESIRVLDDPISTDRGAWTARRMLIDPLPHHTVRELHKLYEQDQTSLGMVRPTRILDLKIEEADREWKPEWAALFQQMRLFGEQQKPLSKIPYKFSYIFECADNDKPHHAMCEDWELGVLFLNEVERLGSEEKAAESVRKKFFDELCAPTRDTRFYMGTVFPYNAWVVLGVFWPPRLPDSSQLAMF